MDFVKPFFAISQEQFEARLRKDIPWLAEFQRNNWEQFQSLPEPEARHANWRFTDLRKLEFKQHPKLLGGGKPKAGSAAGASASVGDSAADASADSAGGGSMAGASASVGASAGDASMDSAGAASAAENFATLPNLLERPLSEAHFAADGGGVFKHGKAFASNKGLLHCDLLEAACKMPEKLRACLESAKPEAFAGMEKYAAAELALLGNFSFIYVPEGLQLEGSLANYFWHGGTDAMSLACSFVYLERGAKASVLEHHGAGAGSSGGLGLSLNCVHLEPEAELTRYSVQNYAADTRALRLEKFDIEREAKVLSVALNHGGAYARVQSQVRMLGAESKAELYALTQANDEQEFDLRTEQVHLAPKAESKLLYKNALNQSSRTIFSGIIKVEEAAQQTDAYQTNRNLLLSKSAEANSLPGLEIAANDVRCSHGATSGQIDKEQLFYMKARGIPEALACELVVAGFFEEILALIEESDLQTYARGLLSASTADFNAPAAMQKALA